MDVVFKEGLLYLQAIKFGKKTWRKIWMSCFKPSSTGIGRLEMFTVIDSNSATYEHKKTGRLKSQDRKVVRLSDCLSITSAPKESCPANCEAFYLNTISVTYTLASPITQDWIGALCLLAFQKDPEDADKGAFDRGNYLVMEDNDLYSSWESDKTIPPKAQQVTVRMTEASQRCKLTGDYLVSLESDALLLLDSASSDIIYCWPYKMLRKYGQVEGGFSIEAGRRCESGAGKFVFLSKQAQHIFQTISQQCSEKTSATQVSDNQPLYDQSTVHSPITCDPSGFQDLLSPHSDDETLQHYYNLPDTFRQLSVGQAHSSLCGEAAREGSECENDSGSFEVNYLDYSMEESIYYNLPRHKAIQLKEQSTEDSESVYSSVDKIPAQLSPESTAVPSYCPVPKPRYNLQLASTNSMQPYGAQMQVMDKEREEEGIVSTDQITPSEATASFKHRLAVIISKDLAKFQAPVPLGTPSPTCPQ